MAPSTDTRAAKQATCPLIRNNRSAACRAMRLTRYEHGSGQISWMQARGKSAVYAWLFRQHWRMLDVADYELVWPPDLFAAEARRILARSPVNPDAVDLLLREAFRDDSPAEDVASPVPFGARGSESIVSLSAGEALAGLAEAAHSIRRFSVPRPYWPQRHGKAAAGPHLDAVRARDRFAGFVGELERTGYLDQAFPRSCVDDQDSPDPDPAAELAARLGLPGLWPLAPAELDEATFYGLIEVFHDLVARPRVRHLHSYAGCGWHYSQFSVTAGQEVYRWKVNELLKIAGIGYALAGTGEDMGRLVATYNDGRSGLIDNVLANARPESAGQVAHAVALFRSRSADAEYKRSAILTLAGVLEERRQLIKAELGTADEGALFQIANKFAIRHQRAGQQADYGPVFLDWIFWWYLATVELTDRVISRQEGTSA